MNFYSIAFNKPLIEDVAKAFGQEMRDMVQNHMSETESIYDDENPLDVAKSFTESRLDEIVKKYNETDSASLYEDCEIAFRDEDSLYIISEILKVY
ncbi:hypothetical protein MXB_2368 [Myxobolus squamalis]|nr:hypothetical protein MXB_2368 [Myxobolus squamalis]